MFGSRRLITRRPGAGGPASLLLGAALVALAVSVFLAGLGSDRSTLGFDAGTLADRWNAAAAATGREELRLPALEPRPAADHRDLAFTHRWSDTFTLLGRVDPRTGLLVEASVVGYPSVDDPATIAAAMDLLVATTEPSLTRDERVEALQELGAVGGGAPVLRATRGTTDYVYGAGTSGAVGLSAAPTGTS